MTGTDSGATGALTQRWNQALMHNYGTPAIELTSGSGARVVDAAGNTYVDFLGGIAVNALGHAHPAIAAAVGAQLGRLGHVSNLYIAEPPVALAERLLGLFDRPGRVYFGNSGAEANEAAFKIARRTGRPQIIAAEGGFHGRTMGALAMTGQPAKREPFAPLPGGVDFVPYGDVDALRAAVGPRTAAVILEPIQGENGVVMPGAGYLAAAREITAAHGALLILDEIQTGIARTGAWFAHQPLGIEPDVVTLAKGLGGGLPIGACVAFGPAAELLRPGQHGTTFGGNPICCAAALAVLDTIENDDLCTRSAQLGERLRAGIDKIAHPLVDEVSGAGLLIGIVLTAPVAQAVQRAAQDAGFLVNAAVPTRVRLAPPLVVDDADVDALLGALPAILDAGLAAAPAGGTS
ncbi:aspartate aminotransferase family protein [Embleya scabrispora]|uniref:Acetylornithine aminotransferase n=1 Tax=Embleya scabrispora TaxID=159449 RepID=A0A1T3P5H4_9ACTN|nr:acetylornithine transaminase [Embleya scabrispora]OPC84338.1 aspartate aminotransferase family protein [Embleya scabrispora]